MLILGQHSHYFLNSSHYVTHELLVLPNFNTIIVIFYRIYYDLSCRNCNHWLETFSLFFFLSFFVCCNTNISTHNLATSITALLPLIFIFNFHYSIRHPSSAVDDESNSKFTYKCTRISKGPTLSVPVFAVKRFEGVG